MPPSGTNVTMASPPLHKPSKFRPITKPLSQQPAQSPEPATTPPTDSASPSPSTGNSSDGNEPPHEHRTDRQIMHGNYMDLTSTPDTAPTAPSQPAAAQPSSPSPLSLGTNNSINPQILDERHTIDRLYGLECGIQSNCHIGNEHRFSHPQLYRLCTGGLLTGDIIHAILDIHNNMRPKVCFKHLDNYVRDPTHSNVPSHRLLKELFSAQLVGLLHNHNGVHWGLS